ncbi:MAG: hypothetical protein P1V97_38465 [Planctomycetota bacterium]|nr:hypothetical protein [Planctomycetota bacterium]
MNILTRAQKSLCILLILSMFFMGCSSVNQKSGSFSDSMQTSSLSYSHDQFSDNFVAVLLIISIVGLLVLLADTDRKEERRHRRGSRRGHRHHSHHYHGHYDCSCY